MNWRPDLHQSVKQSVRSLLAAGAGGGAWIESYAMGTLEHFVNDTVSGRICTGEHTNTDKGYTCLLLQ